MNDVSFEDLDISFSLLNFLFSGYQGAFASTRLLGELEDYRFTQEAVTQYDRVLTRTYKSCQELLQGPTPLLFRAWTEVETFEATIAFDDLLKLKNEIRAAANAAHIIHREYLSSGTIEDVKYLMALHGRYVYAKDFFLKGRMEFASRFGIENWLYGIPPLIDQSQDEMGQFEAIFSQVKQGDSSKQVLQPILAILPQLATIFEIQGHEACLLLNLYTQEILFPSVDIDEAEGVRWTTAGISPREAGYWRAYEIGPEEVLAWLDGGVSQAGAAKAWRDAGFSPAEVQEWIQAGIPPVIAAEWNKAGFLPLKALEFLQQGINSPKEAKKKLASTQTAATPPPTKKPR